MRSIVHQIRKQAPHKPAKMPSTRKGVSMAVMEKIEVPSESFITKPYIPHKISKPVALKRPKLDSMQVLLDEDKKIVTVLKGNYAESVPLSITWLRDSCQCPKCYNSTTFQRISDTINTNRNVRDARLTDSNSILEIIWKDGHYSKYPLEQLMNTAEKHKKTMVPTASHVHSKDLEDNLILGEGYGFGVREWNASTFSKGITAVKAAELGIVNDVLPSKIRKEGLKTALEALHRDGFVIIDNVPRTEEATRLISQAIGPLKNTIFGDYWDIKLSDKSDEPLEHHDTAYTSVGVPPHTDGSYLVDPPGLQVFRIPHHEGEGGYTLLADGFYIASQIKNLDKEAYNYLCKENIKFQYIEPGQNFNARAPVFGLDSTNSCIERFRFNDSDRSYDYIPTQKAELHYKSIDLLIKLSKDPNSAIQIKLSPDQMLITNNWRVLHGRTEFTGNRRLAGCYISTDDFRSRLRVLRE